MLVKTVRKAVIPAAGLGTRFLPVTKSMPKEMLPIINVPAIHYVVDEAIRAGIEDIIIVTARGKRSIEDYFDDSPELEAHLEGNKNHHLLQMVRDVSALADIHYIRQKEPRGLGDAILRAKRHIEGEPFAVFLGDDLVRSEKPCISQLMEVFHERKSSVIAVEEVPPEKVSSYGIIRGIPVTDRLLMIEEVIEKPRPEDAPSRTGAVGRYVFTPELFDCIDTTTTGAGDEIQLADAINRLIRTQQVFAFRFEGIRYDTGDKLGYLRTVLDFALDDEELRPRILPYLRGIVREHPETR
jgi:UTP--glucose-1-phosphate uridylyltransferase